MDRNRLAKAIELWFAPRSQAEEAVVVRKMTALLEIWPDQVSGFPTIPRLTELIWRKLRAELMTLSTIKVGDRVTTFASGAVKINNPKLYNPRYKWVPGYTGKVETVYPSGIEVNIGKKVVTVNPLYSPEVLKSAGVEVDFLKLNQAYENFGKTG